MSSNGLGQSRTTAWLLLWLLAVLSFGLAQSAQGGGKSRYNVIRKFKLPTGTGGPDGIAIDSEARRLYVTHLNEVDVLDADSEKQIGTIENTLHVSDVVLAPELHRGFTSNHNERTVTIFDTRTLAPLEKVRVKDGTDAITYDSSLKRVFVAQGKLTAIDASNGKVAGTVSLGEGETEDVVSDDKGTVYVALADQGAIAVVDGRSLSLTKTYRMSRDCVRPHTLVYADDNQRLLVGCRGTFHALDARTGEEIGRSQMCSGADGADFDSDERLVFESCYDGTMSVIHETKTGYELIDTVVTQPGAGTMTFDTRTKNIYLPVASNWDGKGKGDDVFVLVVGQHPN